MRLILAVFLCALHSAVAAAPRDDIQALAGVYKHRFANFVVNPGHPDDQVESEDVVEVVPYDEHTIYVRAELAFANGHSCSIHGMAVFENGAFVYHDPKPDMDGCILKLSRAGDDLLLNDRTGAGIGSCRVYCGARGSLSDYRIKMSSRRPIRYLPRLKASREYKEAEEEYLHGAPAR